MGKALTDTSLRELSPLEQKALTVRHRAALAQLASTDAENRWKLLCAVVAPGEKWQLVSENRARALLGKAAV